MISHFLKWISRMMLLRDVHEKLASLDSNDGFEHAGIFKSPTIDNFFDHFVDNSNCEQSVSIYET